MSERLQIGDAEDRRDPAKASGANASLPSLSPETGAHVRAAAFECMKSGDFGSATTLFEALWQLGHRALPSVGAYILCLIGVDRGGEAQALFDASRVEVSRLSLTEEQRLSAERMFETIAPHLPGGARSADRIEALAAEAAAWQVKSDPTISRAKQRTSRSVV